jgi:hypothetical protein
MRWAWHVNRIEEKRNAHRLFIGNPKGKRLLENQDIDGWIILRWIVER